jgi:hypothetical protein
MTVAEAPTCPICGGADLEPICSLTSPILPLIGRQTDGAAAYFAPVDLCRCAGCGHVFNRGFEPGLETQMYDDAVLTNVPVDPSMHGRLAELSSWLPDERIDGAHVVEIGTGGGHLARLLATRARTVTVIEPCRALTAAAFPEPNIEFVQDSFPLHDRALERADLVIARQVLEHVQDPRAFLVAVAAILDERGQAFIEVPSLEYIMRRGAICDIHAQHIQYFSEANLRRLAESAGLMPVRSLSIKDGHDFGLLFQKTGGSPTRGTRCTGDAAIADGAGFRRLIAGRQAELGALDLAAFGRVALYGATMQGVAFLNLLSRTTAIAGVIDDNDGNAGFGLFTPDQWFRIRPLRETPLETIDTVVITAYIHDAAIAGKLRAAGFGGRILSVRADADDALPQGMVPSLMRRASQF